VSVKVTDVSPGDVAVIEYVAGATPVVNVTTAFPDGPVVVDIGVSVPPLDDQATGMFGTGFPNWSADRTMSDADPVATTVWESTLILTSLVGAAANAVAVAFTVTPVAASASVFTPDVVPSVHETVACPLASEVALGAATEPLPDWGVNVTT